MVIDPERLTYVAGSQRRHARILDHIGPPGVFRYETTPNGDGRVP